MASFKVIVILFCILLIGQQSLAVLNKSSNKNSNDDEAQNNAKGAEDRISNEYGVPPRPNFGGPAPVYGPPELTGNHGPVQIFPPPPAESPPLRPLGPAPRPFPSYGPPRNQPQLQFGPRPQKFAPWKLSPQPNRFGVTKPAGHGPPIPISLEAYGPPNNIPSQSFSISRPSNEYGPPPPFPAIPPVPQQPPPGVPAPPTPPDIKYDGWQPIAGHIETPNAFPQQEPNHANNINPPSNSYGELINNIDDHNLKQSVGPSNSDSGLPPPQLPDFEPYHNIQEPAKSIDLLPTTANAQQFSSPLSNDLASHTENQENLSYQQLPQFSTLQPSSPPPPPPSSPQAIDSYGVPPPSSFSANGPYPPSAQGSFNLPSFNKQGFQQHHRQQHSFNSYHHQKNHNSFRPHSLSGAFNPPRNRAPLKFREPNPLGHLNSIHRFRPLNLPLPSGGYNRPSFSFSQQQPPVLNNAISFNSNSASLSNVDNINSPLGDGNLNYGTPLTFSSFNTPAPVLTYGAANTASPTSFALVSSQSGANGGNLYEQNSLGALSPAYGTPSQQSHLFNVNHDCNQQNLGQSQLRQSQLNSIETSSVESGYQVPSINELELEPHNVDQQTDIKDSYGNPTGVAFDQRSSSSSSVLSSGQSAESLTAALTAQGYSQQASDHLATTNELNIDQLARLHGDSEPALALAQTLSAEGAADGFQIQGSKGTYTLQIQSANGPQTNENSDGTIRHDQLLSNGLLQDILAAIEKPGQGQPQLLSIQGSPQSQPLQEVFEQKEYGARQDLNQAASSSAINGIDSDSNTASIHEENVALFFNNNGFEESNKQIRSTVKSEGVVGEEATQTKDSDKNSSQKAS